MLMYTDDLHVTIIDLPVQDRFYQITSYMHIIFHVLFALQTNPQVQQL